MHLDFAPDVAGGALFPYLEGMALDGLPHWAAGDGVNTFAYVHLAPSLDQMARAYARAQAGLLPDEPILVVGEPTCQDPSRAPDGKHVLWLHVRMAPGPIKGDAAGRNSGPAYRHADG